MSGLLWWVVDHDNDDKRVRGPFDHQETAGAVRREMECIMAEDRNLWVVDDSFWFEHEETTE